MRKLLFQLLAFLAFGNTQAQILEPVKWTSRVEKVSDTEFNLVMEGKIDPDWHVYSQFTPDGGPLPIELKYLEQQGNYTLVGKTTESKYEKKFNDVFGVDEYFFSKKFWLKQKVKITNPGLAKIQAKIDYQVCKESCINGNYTFTFVIPKLTTPTTTAAAEAAETAKTNPVLEDTIAVATAVDPVSDAHPNVQPASSEVKAPEEKEQKSIWLIFLGTIAAGILATFTPCIFPMIPMTVSFFLKQSGNKARGRFNAIFYGACIVTICVLITLPFHIIEGISGEVFADISTNVYINLFFFLIFAIFAISFFGAFEITLPSRFANKADSASNSGGLIGIFFMALTLIIVSFSCVGPALGLVLGTALNSDGGATILSIAFLGFGLGMALPFMFFALAPSLLSNLPKSGGWLNTVKVVFGFIELALAFKFLSNADLVLQLHLLEREVFLAIWIAIFAALSLYLFGKLKMPHDSDLPFISVGRMLLGVLSLSFTIYLVPGLWGAPLKLISAFPPPPNYSESPLGFGGAGAVSISETLPEGANYGPHKIISFEDYAEGMAYAKQVGKPAFIDFTGRACQNCRLTENNVWSDERILKMLQNDVVLISLFCDERTPLPENKQYISKLTGSKIETIGEKWSEFQRERYGSNARPYYVLVDHDEKSLNEPIGYTPNVEEYHQWLAGGIAKFKK
ncbi:cytochrome c biogenesis protein CcdA [Flavobacterium sp.]|uniref:protein-disulfide reductase DsbD family protein n=1 Tax=Flavobacterium sp. TaxID=239 RepID=UPI0039E333BD